MLVVGGADESTLRSFQRIPARGNMEVKPPIVASDRKFVALPILQIGDGDPAARQRSTALRLYHRSGDAVRTRRNLLPLGTPHLRRRQQQHPAERDCGKASARPYACP